MYIVQLVNNVSFWLLTLDVNQDHPVVLISLIVVLNLNHEPQSDHHQSFTRIEHWQESRYLRVALLS